MRIAIYSNYYTDIGELKNIIYEYLINNKIVAKVSVFENNSDVITASEHFDVYVMDMDMYENIVELGQQLNKINAYAKFIYTSKDTTRAYEAAQAEADYFLAKPYDKEQTLKVFKKIRKSVQDDNIVINTADGERRIRANTLNYINIVNRCLCYHLTDGTIFDGQTLRSSFEKAISPLQFNRSNSFLFLPPSLLINVGEIKILDTNKVIFENNDILYISRKQHDLIDTAWKSYTRFVNID